MQREFQVTNRGDYAQSYGKRYGRKTHWYRWTVVQVL